MHLREFSVYRQGNSRALGPDINPGRPTLLQWFLGGTRLRNVILLGCVFAVVVGFQSWAGAYAAERGNYSDEAAHFMNGPLLRDYAISGFPGSPVAFAQRYYVDYPKIAPFMWPPLFHTALGISMLVVPDPRLASLLLVALATTWTGWRLFRLLEERVPVPLALVGLVLLLTTPVVINMTTALMLDMVVAAFVLESAFCFARYVQQPTVRRAAIFGVVASAACLTKGNGLAVLLIPPLFIVATGEWRILRYRTFWLAVALIALLAGPLVVFSLRLDAHIGDFGATTSASALSKFLICVGFLSTHVGTPVLVMAIGGSVVLLASWHRWSDRMDPLPMAVACVPVSAVLVHALTPLQSLDARYLAMAVAPLWFALITGGVELGRMLGRRQLAFVWACLMTLAIGISWSDRESVTIREPLGAERLVHWFTLEPRPAPPRVLIVSDETGEGALVSEFALRRASSPSTIIRASKLLAKDNWNGKGFDLTFRTPTELLAEMTALHVDAIVLDESISSPVSRQVEDAIQLEPGRYQRLITFSGTRALAVYEPTTQTPGPRKTLRVTPSPTGETLESY